MSIPVYGDNSETTSPKQLYPGWNAIGFAGSEMPASEAFSSLGDKWLIVLGYNSGLQQYERTIFNSDPTKNSSIEPGKGYWIYLGEAGEYNLPLLTPISPTTGNISLNSNPTGAIVYLDDTNTDQTTNTVLSELSPGSHKVLLNLTGYYNSTEQVAVTAGQTVNIFVSLMPTSSPPITGNISVNSNPAGARMYLDGTNTGQTTNTVLNGINPGSHTIVLNLTGYYDSMQQVMVNAGQTANINTILTQVSSPAANLTIRFIDVGQGDSILIQAPNGHDMLVDAGESNEGSKVSDYAKSQGVNEFQVVLATHPDADHVGGMAEVVNDFPIDKYIYNGYNGTTTTFTNLMSLISQKGLNVQTVRSGDIINLDPNITIEVLSPPSPLFTGDTNVNSIVLKVTKGNVSFLLEGDAETQSENYMISSGAVLRSDILKVAHHGSDTSNSEAFLSQVRPKVSVIEVGLNNQYGLPDESVVQRLTQIGSAIYRTDYNGTITVTSDGSTYYVTTEKAVIPVSPASGNISVYSNPTGAAIFLDSISTSQTTNTVVSGISPGLHTIVLNLTGYYDSTQQVSVVAGQTAYISTSLNPIPSTPLTGNISVISNPVGALIYLDGTNTGQTTNTVLNGINPGLHTILLNLTGYYDSTGQVTVIAGQTWYVSTSLSPISNSGNIIVSDLNLVGEYVTIYNAGGYTVSLTGWELHDEGLKHTYIFQDVIIAPGATITIHSHAHGTDTATDLYWTGNNVWNNDGDTAYLIDSQGNLISSLQRP